MAMPSPFDALSISVHGCYTPLRVKKATVSLLPNRTTFAHGSNSAIAVG
jgi:hypothetical protein